MLWGAVIVTLSGGGWAWHSGQVSWPSQASWPSQVSWPAWLPTDIAGLFRAMERKPPAPPEPVASSMATLSSPARVEPIARPIALDAAPTNQPPSGKPGAAPNATAGSATPPLTTAALPPPAANEQPGEPLPPARADPADPYQVRAEAVGLHPGLSRVLLQRLSAADYRNAGVAVQKAVTETADGAVFVWPRQRKPEMALFKVHFVTGAAPDCRRYVVTITKDRWSTTALPMERCGVHARHAAGKARRD